MNKPGWRIHVGVHKTATTHLQEVIALQAGELAGEGICLMSRKRLEAQGFLKLIRFGELIRPSLYERLVHRDASAIMRARIMKELAGASTVLISEEKIPGSPIDLIDGFYPHLERYLLALRSIIRDDPVTIFLSIRDQGDLLPSAYCQALRRLRTMQPFNHYLQNWKTDPPRWPSFALRVKAIFPDAAFVVWTLNDYSSDPGGVLTGFTGSSKIKPLKLARPENTQRLSAPAVARLEALQNHASAGGHELAGHDRHPAISEPGSAYDPLSDGDKAFFRAIFEEDLRTLRQLPGVRLFETTEPE